MKKYIIFIILSAFVFYCGKSSKSQERTGNANLKAALTFVKGNVVLIQNGKKSRARAGMLLTQSDTVITGKGAHAEIVIKTYGALKLSENTVLRLTSLFKGDKISNVELKLEKGAIASFIRKRNRGGSYSIVTPTAIAGVRGTVFYTSVGTVPKNSKKNPVVKVAVLSGAVAINLPGHKEIVMTENTQIAIDGFKRISRNMIKPISKESLRQIKEMAVFHKTNILEFNSMINDIRSSSVVLRAMQGGNIEAETGKKNRKYLSSQLLGGSVKRAGKMSGENHIKRNVNKKHIRLKPNSEF